MPDKKKKLVEALLNVYAEEEYTGDLCTFIKEHENDYFGEDFFEELDSKIGWLVRDAVYRAGEDMAFAEEHKNDRVTLDRQNGIMYFNDHGVPAYWYHKDMAEDEIREELDHYRDLWFRDGFPEYQYPLMETWMPLKHWQAEFSKEQIRQMERALERPVKDDEKRLATLRDYGEQSVHRIKDTYPDKIKKITNIKNKRTENDECLADITLKLNDGRQCTIRVSFSKSGCHRGMRALGKHGFPWMTERDNRLILETVFPELADTEKER